MQTRSNPPPKVSIITAAWNTLRFLPVSTASAAAQTFRDHEHIIVDDCSTDGTREAVAALAKDQHGIRVALHAQNRGAGAAKQTGLELARGEYVALLDSDDYWDSQFLECLVAELDRQDDDVAGVFCRSRTVSEEGQELWCFSPEPGRYDLLRFFEGFNPPGNGSCLLLRRESLVGAGGFSATRVGGDTETWLALLAHKSHPSLLCLPERLVNYRKRPGALTATGNAGARIRSIESRLEKFLPEIPAKLRWRVLAAHARYSWWLGEESAPWRRKLAARALLSGGWLHPGSSAADGLLGAAIKGWPANERELKMAQLTS
jgi:hypothetical protein